MKPSSLLLGFALVLGISGSKALSAQTRIYLANDDHTDYMWTVDSETYNAVFVEMLDYYLDLADATRENAAPYQSRFNADGSYWLWNYERRKSPAEFERLMERIKDGHISAPLNTLVSCYGAQPTEAVLRGMYYAGRLERRYGLRFPLAIAMENQTLPLGLSSLWAGSGALYSWKGVCGCASKIPNAVLSKRDHEIYWYTGLDGQRVLMKWYSLGPKGMGTYLEANDPKFAIDFLDTNVDFLSRYTDPTTGKPYSIRAAFGFGGDCLARKTGVPADPGVPKEPGVQQGIPGSPQTEHFHVTARQQTTADRQVIVSNTTDFFDDFVRKYGTGLPSESVTYGNEWDLYSASMAETSARVRRSVEKLRAAELMSTLVSLQKPAFLKERAKARDLAATVSNANRTLENSVVKVVVAADGSLTSLIDKVRGNAELAAVIGGRRLNALSSGDATGTVTVENSGPVSVTLRCVSGAGVEHTTWVTLYRDSDRIDIRNRITANFSDLRYWSFGFNLIAPDIHTEEVGAILHDRLKSQGGDYADSHARYDHVTLNHFADITDGAGKQGVTLSNADCSFAKLGVSTTTVLDTATPQINVLAGGQVDGRYLGIQDQSGATSFLQRFSLHPHGAYDPAAAMRFSLEHQNPLVTGGVSGVPASPYPADRYSLLTLSDPDVLLWAVKPAEEGIEKGVIARLWNVTARARSVQVTLTSGLTAAKQVTHIETDLAPLPVTKGAVKVHMKQAQIQTLRLLGPTSHPK